MTTIHETITTLTLPDQPPEPPPEPGQLVSRARRRMESIPFVTVGQIGGLISISTTIRNLQISTKFPTRLKKTLARP